MSMRQVGSLDLPVLFEAGRHIRVGHLVLESWISFLSCVFFWHVSAGPCFNIAWLRCCSLTKPTSFTNFKVARKAFSNCTVMCLHNCLPECCFQMWWSCFFGTVTRLRFYSLHRCVPASLPCKVLVHMVDRGHPKVDDEWWRVTWPEIIIF